MNRLARETSPYLKQHETNPVDWYPWGPEALEKAKQENKPILLSVGYSACHWCHVMAHESFENPEIAALMNQHFVNVKVDREERPDLDQIYQNVAQAMTRGGGWPLTVFLLPDQRPFYGGTYFPPEDRYGRPGFPRVLTSLAQAYQSDRAGIEENAEKLTKIIAELESEAGGNVRFTANEDIVSPGGASSATLEKLRESAESLLAYVDWTNGGLGSHPKFPNPMTFQFLWRMGRQRALPREFRESAFSAVALTLSKMAQGGIYDQLGGGFSRYSVDETWSVPHFEKMLYDNGLLLSLYSEVLLTDRAEGSRLLSDEMRALFLTTVSESVRYVLREMTSPAGGFYAAQDADSEGEEGKYFVWDPEELSQFLSADEARAFSLRYGVDRSGNFEHGKTVLYQAHALPEIASEMKIDLGAVATLIESAREKLFRVREKRVKPGLDDKQLVAWNGLMISGLSWASAALRAGGETELASQTLASANGAYEQMKKVGSLGAEAGEARLASTIQAGRAKGAGYLDDYAFMARAALDLSRHAGHLGAARVRALHDDARSWMRVVIARFKDPARPGYFFTSDDHEKLLERPKTLHDQAIPSGTGVVLGVLQFLEELDPVSGASFGLEWRAQMAGLSASALRNPHGFGELLLSQLLSIAGAGTVEGESATSALWSPFVVPKAAGDAKSGEVLFCHRQSCQVVTGDADAVLSRIERELGVG